MKQVTIYTTDEEYDHFIELAKSLTYVKGIEEEGTKQKAHTLKHIRKGFEEMQKIKSGKAKTVPLKKFLDEL
ncbi:hypothetical protein [Niabella ginsengisoli]|uniref:Prevent-host-death protein n=1 Tax=Niabella ginsengisoli TaxID=522298 RepID=A0ABS9SNR1_9BACT|nr:hypothetical protein [Niabella ginsengisoli]MCH5600016.1 hypothetical protein [Niabella ginsengisoli]